MNKIAIVASVKATRVTGYDNQATQGADAIANALAGELSYAFNNIQVIQNYTTKARIVDTLTTAAKVLDPGGLCVFYFHGHGDSLPNVLRPDQETRDQALVCYDGFLFDYEIDLLLQNFLPSHRLLTIVDSCSSETVIEWNYPDVARYPQIIHIGASRDGDQAGADTLGGIMSRNILNSVYGYGYANYTYLSFCQRIKQLTGNQPAFRTSPGVQRSFLNAKLFT